MRILIRPVRLLAAAAASAAFASALAAPAFGEDWKTAKGCVGDPPATCVAVNGAGLKVRYVTGAVYLAPNQRTTGHLRLWGPGISERYPARGEMQRRHTEHWWVPRQYFWWPWTAEFVALPDRSQVCAQWVDTRLGGRNAACVDITR